MKKTFLIFTALLFVLFISGCSNKTKKDNIVTPTSSDEPVIEKTISIVDTESNSRPYAVVINNFPSAVKVQTGLSDAYMVYEIPVEGGMSRSLAFFKDKYPTKIGTVRSARHNFLDYVMENDAIFAHFGWSHYAKDQIPQLGINHIDGNSSDPGPFWRENPESLAWEHTAYGDLEKVKARAIEKGYRQTTDSKLLLNYTTENVDLAKKGGSIANNVTISYSTAYKVKFAYNSEDNRYYRYVNNAAHTDYFTKEQYSTKNIIVVKISYTYTDGGYYLELKNIGNGDGYYITNGYVVPIKWQKDNRSSQTIYRYTDGTEINVNDGNTYIMLQSVNSNTTIE